MCPDAPCVEKSVKAVCWKKKNHSFNPEVCYDWERKTWNRYATLPHITCKGQIRCEENDVYI